MRSEARVAPGNAGGVVRGANYLWSVALGDASMASPCERACDWALRAATMGGLSLAVGASLAANAAVAALAPQAWAAKMVHDWAPRTARQGFDASKVEPQALATTGFVVVARRECEAKASAWQAANVAATWWAWTAQAAQAVGPDGNVLRPSRSQQTFFHNLVLNKLVKKCKTDIVFGANLL